MSDAVVTDLEVVCSDTARLLSARISRAHALARAHPASAEPLAFYADIAAFQHTLLRDASRIIRAPHGDAPLAAAVDAAALAALVPGLLEWLATVQQGRLAGAAQAMAQNVPEDWQRLIDASWRTHDRNIGHAHGVEPAHVHDDAAGETELFVVEALLQPFAETLATARQPTAGAHRLEDPPAAHGHCCPFCGGLPVVATLRERGHGAPRALVCGLCLTEWPAPRIVCPSCGETGFDALPIYRAEEFPGIRIDGCDSCDIYIKTIDLTIGGAAIPVVDDLASLPLDLWATQRGYRKIRPNLLRL
jgi:FdhE protein